MTVKHTNKVANQAKFPFVLPDLPYDTNALEPHMSARTFSFHHGKHHATYVNNLNKLVEGTELEGKSLEEIMSLTANDSKRAGIFNNAAQVWNHTFFWHSLSPEGGGEPEGKLIEVINNSFGDFNKFKEEFKKAATTQFGSGWAWLVAKGDELEIIKTPNAKNPIIDGYKILMNCDVWEHAYYLDYQNKRPDYIDVFLEKLVNWHFAEKNFD